MEVSQKLPISLYVVPTEDLVEDEEIDGVLTKGWEQPPTAGSTLLIVPSDPGQQNRRVRWLYTVVSVSHTDNRDWPLDLEIEAAEVRKPCTWYELVRQSQIEGLVPLSGAKDQGDCITHSATIRMIYEMLGEI